MLNRIIVLPLIVLFLVLPSHAEEGAKKKIVLVAGRPSHGRGEHEFRAGCVLLANALNESVPNVNAVCTFNGWPEDESIFDGAAAVVIYCDGGGGHPVRKHWETLDKLAKQGAGIACMHYAVEIPKGHDGEMFSKYIGGYYEDGYSINPHWMAQAELNPNHPITRGVSPFKLKDEWYFSIRFPEDRTGLTSILDSVPDEEARSGKSASPRGPKKHVVERAGQKESLMWCIERPDGGRGFGFTGGHFHSNWANDDYRKLILNGIAWIAKIDVPEKGIASKSPTKEEMDANIKK